MRWIRNRQPATGIALAALVIALGGAAFAAIPDSSGTVHACYQKSNGNLRVVESANDCRSTERPITLSEGHPSSLGTQRALSKLSYGQSARMLTVGPFTFQHVCDTVDGSTVVAETSEEGSYAEGHTFGPSSPFPVERDNNTIPDGFGGHPRLLVSPSGTVVRAFAAVGVKVLGADCFAELDVIS